METAVSDLLDTAVRARGGLGAWSQLSSVWTDLQLGDDLAGDLIMEARPVVARGGGRFRYSNLAPSLLESSAESFSHDRP